MGAVGRNLRIWTIWKISSKSFKLTGENGFSKEKLLRRTGSILVTLRGGGEGFTKQTSECTITSAFYIRLAQGVVEAIWLNLGALNQGYYFIQ